jgi:alanine racemase
MVDDDFDQQRLRPSWMEIDLERLALNTLEVRRVIGPERKLIAVAKADAYGHGIVRVAPKMIEAGANVVALGNLRDAIRLRESGFAAPLLLFGSYVASDVARVMVEYRIMPTIWDEEGVKAFTDAAHDPLPVYLKVDTGFHRLGVSLQEAVTVARAIQDSPNLRIACVYTHFADPVKGEQFTRQQFDRILEVVDAVRAAGIRVPYVCAASSAIISTLSDMYLDAVDPGRLLYGFHYPYNPPVELRLKPIVRALRSRIIQTRWVEAGDSIGYGRRYHASKRSLVGVLPIGWSDGLIRNPKSSVQVLVRGTRCPIIGSINLEHCMADLTRVDGATAGDEVVLFGKQGNEVITLKQHAEWVGVSEMEAVLHFGRSIPRVYFEGSDNQSDDLVTAS